MDTFKEFVQQLLIGLMAGSLYSVLALALVLVFVSTRMINFAQGELGGLSAFAAWAMLSVSIPYALGFPIAVALAFLIGAAMLRFIALPLMGGGQSFAGKGPIGVVVAGIGLLLVMTAVETSIWGPDPHRLETPFHGDPISIADINLGQHNVYLFAIAGLMTFLTWAIFQYTKSGLAMRATAMNRTAAELMGVPTDRMLTLGWGLAGGMSAVAAMLIAPIVVLQPGFMLNILLFGFAAAVLGGFDSPQGAVIGGLIVGVAQTMTGVYLGRWVDFLQLPFDIAEPAQYRDVVAMSLIILVLVIRPRGLWGKPEVGRV